MANGSTQPGPSMSSVGSSPVTGGVAQLGPTQSVPPTTAVLPEQASPLTIDPTLTIDITPSPFTDAVFTVRGPFTVMQAPMFGGTVVGGLEGDFIIAGGPGDDYLAGSDLGTNVLIGGNGDNTLTAIGAATTFVHNAGGVDVITDFRSDFGDHITWDKGLTVTRSGQGTITDADANLTDAQGLIVEFSDGSKIGLAGIVDRTSLDPSWLTPPPDPASTATYSAILPAEGGGQGNVIVQGAPVGGAPMGVAGFLGSGVLLGGPGDDHLVGSALGGNNVIAGGAGRNTLESSNAATFVHNAGGDDVLAGFNPGLDHITWDQGLTVISSGQGLIRDPVTGIVEDPGLVVTFSDGSVLALPGQTTVTALPPDWLI